ncbi:hypothetical protein ACFQER_13955 [Halomicroarcula sp. GCM10025894]|uniref:hypothetical protein n=1 Tax=Halomicroarcula sp. GCM10025894 TaxID=3252673 RepID=UPI0036070DBE
MGDGTVLFGMSAVITGLLFYLLGTGKIRIRPAGWFDFVVGTSLVGYGTFMIWRGIGRFASFYPVFFLYLLGALFQFGRTMSTPLALTGDDVTS